MSLYWNRREFLEFMGRSSALAALPGCSSFRAWMKADKEWPFSPLSPSLDDALLLAEGLKYRILIQWGDPINAKGDKFGYNNDFLAFIPLRDGLQDDGLLWVNHETAEPLFVNGQVVGAQRTREAVEKEMLEVGGSIVRVKQDPQFKDWFIQKTDPLNRRITAKTEIPFDSSQPIVRKKSAIGTLGNCAGGVTPWKTILTCEENYHHFYGEREEGNLVAAVEYKWDQIYPYPPEHYGWVVEVFPFTGKAVKRTALGRFAHEGATVHLAGDGRPVVYMGDDAPDQCLYKFIGQQKGNLEKGVLYVANIEKGQWLALDWKTQSKLKSKFRDQLDVLIHAREAAALLGGTPLDRPEDIEVDPKTGDVLAALTNNSAKGNYFGSILKIKEKSGNPLALEFESKTFLAGGEGAGLSCPDNLAFDSLGNLWVTTDMSGSVIGKTPFKEFGNNGLFYIPMSGKFAGQAFQVASAPRDAELTGPCFSPDEKTLFLSVQHPGEKSKSLTALTSHWPQGGQSIPRSAVVAISGPTLEKLMQPGGAGS